MRKRKHRVVVEVTMDSPCTEKHAAWALRDMIEYAVDFHSHGFTKLAFKQFSRVAQHKGKTNDHK